MNGAVDLLVIGGGIVGSCVARDAAMRGLSALLVERNDFASGTSGNSSRLLHGGIRYLSQGRIGLVREASREKVVLGRVAPHLVEPLAFVYPAGSSSGHSRWQLAVGVWLYDRLCRGQNYGPSKTMGLAALKDRVPGLDAAGVTGAVRYYDALTQDARLVIDHLRSAAAHGATARNYTTFVDASRSGDAWVCAIRDEETGQSERVNARAIVNAAGPWSGDVPHSRVKLRPTKGVHLVIDHARLPVTDAVVMAEGQRILFAIPWGERTFLGTTDTDVEDLQAPVHCEPADRDYILEVVNRWFPNLNLSPSDVRSTWAGLRPLVADRHGNPSDISRRHEITSPEPGWWDVAGGKLTTCRLMAEQTVDRVAKHLGGAFETCRTAHEPLLPDHTTDHSGVLPPPVSEELVQHICREEWVGHLDDLLIRRTSWAFYHDDLPALVERVAPAAAAALQWSDDRRHQECARFLARWVSNCATPQAS